MLSLLESQEAQELVFRCQPEQKEVAAEEEA